MLLSELLPLPPEYDRPITGLTLDSRTVLPGNVFVAIAGTKTHGEVFIAAALQKGAIAVLKETPMAGIEILAGGIPCIKVPNLSQQLGEFAAHFYGQPSRGMQVIGVTGTNGKTSTTHFIAQILHSQSSSRPCGLIGTLGYGTYDALQPGLHTTPDALQLQALLAQLKTQEVPWTVMEVSSHALAQGRINGIQFDTAVFTNLSRDHLDYHQTMTAYGEAKRQLFMKPDLKTAVINYDDAFGQILLNNLPNTVTPLTYSLQHYTADVYAQIRHSDAQGSWLSINSPWGRGQLQSPLLGKFNVSNVLATLTVLLNLGFPFLPTLTQLNSLRPVPGRMERFGHTPQPTVIVDYAHTPDALQQTLSALREHCQGQLWCVFGCGGNRDRGKRPLMGEVAQRYADKVILTDDNPRHEDSQAIINDILPGCPTPTAIIADRTQAIGYALHHATPADVILIAGKGHENYQQIGDQRLPFSDRTLVASFLMDNG
jgi:UDP-N-acetylmuramoyl-L-alanyl-D-glutamate--2,6-diaminopimelate ligase